LFVFTKTYDYIDKQREANFYLKSLSKKDEVIIEQQKEIDGLRSVKDSLRREILTQWAYEAVLKEKNATIKDKEKRIKELNNHIVWLGSDIVEARQKENIAYLDLLTFFGYQLDQFQCDGDRKKICELCDILEKQNGI
jgi:hypothetical protein